LYDFKLQGRGPRENSIAAGATTSGICREYIVSTEAHTE
jgi:hypothetical protein